MTTSTRSMKTSTRWWLLAIAAIVVLSFVLPFTVFRNVDAWYGSFLFWCAAAIAAIAINAIVSSKWKD